MTDKLKRQICSKENRVFESLKAQWLKTIGDETEQEFMNEAIFSYPDQIIAEPREPLPTIKEWNIHAFCDGDEFVGFCHMAVVCPKKSPQTLKVMWVRISPKLSDDVAKSYQFFLSLAGIVVSAMVYGFVDKSCKEIKWEMNSPSDKANLIAMLKIMAEALPFGIEFAQKGSWLHIERMS